MSLTQSVAPTVEPITTAEAKAQAHVSTAADADYIDSLIAASREQCEIEQARSYITQTWVLRLDRFPAEIELPRPPVQSVTSVAYIDTDGDSQTLTVDTDYQVSLNGVPPRIMPAVDKEWPTVRESAYDAVTVTYVAGYGGTGSDVPDNVKLAVKILVAHWYRLREPVVDGSITTAIPWHIGRILGARKVVRLG